MHSTFLRRARGTLAVFCLAAAGAKPVTAMPPVPNAPPVVGLVQDSAGTPLPNVRIVVADMNRTTTTSADGTFVLRALRPGRYHLDATLIGYAPAEAEIVIPPAGSEVRVTITMRPSPLALEGLHVTALPGAADPLRITQSTTELSGKELARNLGASIAQTLGDEPGISVRYAGPGASAPVIRGLSGDRVLVLENGQRTGDLSSTSPDHGLSIDPLSANRIEVVRGPAALLYGNNALGGVVNVISEDIPTSVPTHLEGFAAVQGESVNPGGAGTASVSLPLGESFAVTLRGGGRNVGDVRIGGDGELGNTDFSNLHGTAGVGYISEALTGGVAASAYGFEYGIPAPPDAEESGVRLEGERQEVKGRADLVLGTFVLPSLRLDGTAQWYTHDEIEDSGEIGTTFNLRTQTLGLTGRTAVSRLTGAVGASALFKQYEATGEEALTPAANSNSGGVFLYQELPLGGAGVETSNPVRLQFGARYDVYRIDSQEGGEKFGPARSRDFNKVSGSAGVSIPLRDRVSLGVSAARAFRAPTVEELFSNAFHVATGSFDVGDPDLDAEVNQGLEAVLRAQTPGINAQFAAFYNRIDDFIFPDIVGDTLVEDEEEGGEFTVPLNLFSQEDATLVGAEGEIEGTVARNFVLGAMGDVVRGEFTGGSPIPFMPAARIGGAARWDNGRYSVGTEARHAFAQDRVSETEFAADAYTLVDLSAGFNLIAGGRVHSVTLRADNVFDVRYREATSRIKDFAPNPGRNLSLVYRVLF